MRTQGLRLQDSPPIEIPFSFFATAPLALAAAAALLLGFGAEVLTSRWMPVTLALTHLGTLGFVSMVMLGALYQMIAVVVGVPVPWLRLAHAVHALLVIGTALLCWGLGAGAPGAVRLATGTLGLGLLLFVLPVGIALARARALDATVFGMRAAVICLVLTAVVGIWMALGFGGLAFPGPRPLWSQVHLSVALLGWVGGLIAAVSWQVLPMFYLARTPPRSLTWGVQGLAAAGAILPLLVLAFADPGGAGAFGASYQTLAAASAAPGVLAVWLLHPAIGLSCLSGRRRKRIDASLRFWQTGLCMAPLVALVGVVAWLSPADHWDLLFGWLALWGWVGAIMHGMLTRILPFLLWLHYYAPLVGEVRVPSVRTLLPEALARRGLVLHWLTLALGAAAILSGWGALARITGAALLLSAAAIAHLVVHVVRQRPRGSTPAETPGLAPR